MYSLLATRSFVTLLGNQVGSLNSVRANHSLNTEHHSRLGKTRRSSLWVVRTCQYSQWLHVNQVQLRSSLLSSRLLVQLSKSKNPTNSSNVPQTATSGEWF